MQTNYIFLTEKEKEKRKGWQGSEVFEQDNSNEAVFLQWYVFKIMLSFGSV